MKRIMQFTRAMLAKGPNETEQQIIKKMLPAEVEKRFYEMTIPDQRHCLNVYYSAKDIVEKEKLSVNKELLLRACLSHDIGRTGYMGTWKKTLCVIFDNVFHTWAIQTGEYTKGCWGKMLHCYYHHQELSACWLRKAGLKEEAAIVELHHADELELKTLIRQKQQAAATEELKILRIADNLN